MNRQESITFRDIPVVTWLFGLISLGGAMYFFSFQSFSGTTILLAGIGLICLILPWGLTITADRNTRLLRLRYWALYLLRKTKEISFDEIATIRVDSMTSMERRGQRTRSFRIEVVCKDNSTIPFRKYYSGGFLGSLRKQKIVDQLRAFIGLHETFDESPVGFMRAIPQVAAAHAAQQQEALTGSNAQEHVTHGVHWQLQSLAMGAAPITRWYSPDFKTRSGFLFLAQKVAGQSTGGFMAAIGKALFQQSISMYGFKGDDIPNVSRAEMLAPVSPQLDAHFMAFTSDPGEARQILTPWMQRPLADWGERHPLKQFQTGVATQLVVLFSPNGVYVAMLGVLPPEQVEELTAIGVEMVKTQGSTQAV